MQVEPSWHSLAVPGTSKEAELAVYSVGGWELPKLYWQNQQKSSLYYHLKTKW